MGMKLRSAFTVPLLNTVPNMHKHKHICEHAQPQVQPLHATGRHPGDVLTKFQPFPTSRESVKAKKLFISHGFWVRNHPYSTHVPMGSGCESWFIPRAERSGGQRRGPSLPNTPPPRCPLPLAGGSAIRGPSLHNTPPPL